ncbi:MAG: hypothetical protein DHS20C06_19740 [Hyphobacterium sp.]|nr:MAG: hypothetical protein DHS20C06_19740 [Hyphobacterium sp.]
MITAALLVLLFQAPPAEAFGLTAQCDINFTVARAAEGTIFSGDLTVECETEEDVAGAEAEALRQAYFERDYDEFRAYYEGERIHAEIELAGDRTGHGIEWWGYSQPLLRIPPVFPRSAGRADVIGSCIVRYNLRGGYSRVQESACAAAGREDSFGVSARNAVRRWIFSAGRDVDCADVVLEFRFDDSEGGPPVPALPPCEATD